MKLGTKMHYSARAMLDLALNYDEGIQIVSTREIAERQGISPKYLAFLLAALRSAGLVRSVLGAQGGHTLTRKPDEINMRQIYQVFEGTEGFVDRATEKKCRDRPDACAIQEIWTQMYHASMAILESTTLEDLARRARKAREDSPST